MKKYFVVADVHGFYNEMIAALNEKGWDMNNPDHIFVSLGDIIDRGKKPAECLEFVLNLPEDRRILIMGNHEQLLQRILNEGTWYAHDKSNGTIQTIRDLTSEGSVYDAIIAMRMDKRWAEYYHSCKLYAEVGDNIFVHGWIPCFAAGEYTVYPIAYNINWRNASKDDWDRALWTNGMEAWDIGIKEVGKTIWCGHWHSSWGHAYLHNYGVEFPHDRNEKAYFSPFKDEGIVAMDACTVYSHKVNCEVIEMED